MHLLFRRFLCDLIEIIDACLRMIYCPIYHWLEVSREMHIRARDIGQQITVKKNISNNVIACFVTVTLTSSHLCLLTLLPYKLDEPIQQIKNVFSSFLSFFSFLYVLCK